MQRQLWRSKPIPEKMRFCIGNGETKKSLELLQKYCEDDVRITKDIYDYVLKNKSLKFTDYWNNPREIEMDFSYTLKNDLSPQATLF